MSSDPSHRPLAAQLSRLVDGLLSESEIADLEETLRRSPTARRFYHDYLATHLDLEGRLQDGAAPDFVESTPATPPRRRTTALLAIAATIPLTAALVLWWTGQHRTVVPAPIPQTAGVRPPGPVLAVTVRIDGASWNLREAPAPGLKLRGGPVQLESGRLMLDLVGGQSMTLEGPAEFELLSEDEMFLRSGNASLQMAHAGETYIIQTPSGAIVDLGTEFSVRVAADGTADVHVFEGSANASITGAGNRTREERLLEAGESVRISDRLEDSPSTSGDFLRQLARKAATSSPAGDRYAAMVKESGPLAWWRFEAPTFEREVIDHAGHHPLSLRGNPLIVGTGGRRFMETNTAEAAGFAIPKTGIPGLDTPDGITVECLIHPTSERHGTILAVENPDLPPPRTGPLSHVVHSPQRVVLERTDRRGSKIGHVHPDYALRALMRSPAGYRGGTNTYSSESHLLHRWVHVAFTNDGITLRLYIDGNLTDEAPATAPFQDALLRPIIGRLQPMATGERRQWTGGIDEVALYGRVLSPDEVRAHFKALDL